MKKYMIGFIVGILLIGIGAGWSVVEILQFTPVDVELKTTTTEATSFAIATTDLRQLNCTLSYDESVPEGRVLVTYEQPEFIEMVIHTYGDQTMEYAYMSWYYPGVDFMGGIAQLREWIAKKQLPIIDVYEQTTCTIRVRAAEAANVLY
ncbi:MAG: hypothetical protein ACRCZJ_08185 [Erysipelotrichaceae bacterium]